MFWAAKLAGPREITGFERARLSAAPKSTLQVGALLTAEKQISGCADYKVLVADFMVPTSNGASLVASARFSAACLAPEGTILGLAEPSTLVDRLSARDGRVYPTEDSQAGRLNPRGLKPARDIDMGESRTERLKPLPFKATARPKLPLRGEQRQPVRRGRIRRIVVLFVLTWTTTAFATTVRPVTVEQLAQGSSHIVIATAGGSYSAWDAAHTAIYTYTTFTVMKSLKGWLPSSTITVKQFGGQVGNMVSRRIGVRQFTVGEELVLFLYPSPNADGTLLITGLMQGRFSVRGAGGAATVSNGMPQPSLVAPVYEAGAPVAQPYRMSLETLEQRVRNDASKKRKDDD